VTADAEEDDDSEANVYQPDLHLDEVHMLLDPTTAPAAYRKAISGLFTRFTFISFRECFHYCSFQPVNCVIIGKMKSLHITVRKHCQ